jgi:hypothetical protein
MLLTHDCQQCLMLMFLLFILAQTAPCPAYQTQQNYLKIFPLASGTFQSANTFCKTLNATTVTAQTVQANDLLQAAVNQTVNGDQHSCE